MARFSRGGLALWWGLHAVAGWRHSRARVRWVGAVVGLARHGEVFVRRVGVVVGLARRDKVVATDLRVAKGGGGGYGLRAARRRQGLARLEGLVTLVRKETKIKKKKTYLYLHAHECRQWRRRGLARLEGRGLCGGEAGV